MKERPILFSASMVRAILDGRKTQTRRVVKVQPPSSAYELALCVSTTGRSSNRGKLHWINRRGLNVFSAMPEHFAPLATVGDRLWVKETFRVVGWDEDGAVTIRYLADGTTRVVKPLVDDFDVWVERQSSRMMRAGARMMQHDLDGNAVSADGGRDECWIEMPDGVNPPATPSIHMPRWASRITLTITDIRVQRLQDITDEDAKAEGCLGIGDWKGEATGTTSDVCPVSPRRAFANLWDSINGEGAWSTNPWVWALTFEVLS